MDENGGSVRRKRGRQSSASNASTPGSATKKRKLDDGEAATTETNGSETGRGRGGRRSFMAALSDAISLARGQKKVKESQSQENLRADSKDESPTKAATMPAKRGRPRPSILGEKGKSVYDFPGSDGETTAAATITTEKTTPRKASRKTAGSQNTTPTSKKRTARGAATADLMDVDDVDPYGVTQLDETPSKPTTEKKRGPGRPPGSKNKKTLEREQLSGTPSRGRLGKTGLANGAQTSPLKSILTPSRKGNDDTPRRRKSVAFGLDKGKKDVEIFFEDLPTTKSTTKSKTTPKIRGIEKEVDATAEIGKGKDGEAQEEEEDDEVCEICLKPDSKAPNEIIFCDNCDLGYHQKCHNVPTIPEGDWLCKNCSQEDISKTPQKAASSPAVNVVPVPADAPDIPNLDKHLPALQRILMDRCTGQRRLRLTGLEEAYGKVGDIVEQTITSGEGNSMLLIGSRGVGKTTVIEKVIADMGKKHPGDFHVVRLSGFIHTDDKLAIRDTWRQLGKEMEVDDDIVHRTSYADTMMSLLALLSHPSEITGEDEGLISQAVIFVIDEFDQFAYHPRQTLLYNLFDIAQARKAPIAVLGCTSRVDVVEMLEKRVKSRFSHRFVYVAPARSLTGFWEVCRQGLVVDKDDAAEEGMDTELEGFDEFMEYWAKKIDRLYKQEAFKLLLLGQYYLSKSVMGFLGLCVLPLAALSPSNVGLQIPRAASVAALAAPMSKLHLLRSLSDLDLGLLIAAARLDIIAHTDAVNFAMAYDEYSSLMGRQRVQSASAGMLAVGGGVRVWGRGVAATSWERLIDASLLVPAGLGGGKGAGGLEAKMWVVDVSLPEIAASVKLSAVLARWCKEI